jgi:hypothetical protein
MMIDFRFGYQGVFYVFLPKRAQYFIHITSNIFRGGVGRISHTQGFEGQAQVI